MPTTSSKAQLPPLNGLVLLGGLSRRMGSDKANLEYHGRPQGLWAYETLQAVCAGVFVSVRAGQDYPWLGQRPLIRDAYHKLGPAAGLLSAADAEPDAAWLLLACDMPLLDRTALSRLVSARRLTNHAVAYRHANGTPEPLCAVYEPAACLALESRIEAGSGSSLRALLEAGPTQWLEPDDANRLANANDPDQRAALAARLAKSNDA